MKSTTTWLFVSLFRLLRTMHLGITGQPSDSFLCSLTLEFVTIDIHCSRLQKITTNSVGCGMWDNSSEFPWNSHPELIITIIFMEFFHLNSEFTGIILLVILCYIRICWQRHLKFLFNQHYWFIHSYRFIDREG